MDPKATNNQSTGGATPVNPAPTLEPKVFDLSSINSVNNHGGGGGGGLMKKKPFIIGILSVLVLTVAALSVGFVAVQKSTSPTPSATDTECIQVNSTNINAKTDTARLEATITNNCATKVNVKYKWEKHWCRGIRFHDSSNSYIVCQGNDGGSDSDWESGDHDLEPGQTSPKFTIEQKIGNTGTCGSAQVDFYYKTPTSAPIGGDWFGTAWGDNECTQITTTPTLTPTLTPTVTPTITPTVTPTITPTVTPTVTPTTTPGEQSYKTCENNACVTHPGTGNSNCNQDSDCKKTTHKACQNNACAEVSGAGSDSCTSDAMCQPAAVPPPIPESGNTSLTLVGIVSGLVALGAALFLAL